MFYMEQFVQHLLTALTLFPPSEWILLTTLVMNGLSWLWRWAKHKLSPEPARKGVTLPQVVVVTAAAPLVVVVGSASLVVVIVIR